MIFMIIVKTMIKKNNGAKVQSKIKKSLLSALSFLQKSKSIQNHKIMTSHAMEGVQYNE